MLFFPLHTLFLLFATSYVCDSFDWAFFSCSICSFIIFGCVCSLKSLLHFKYSILLPKDTSTSTRGGGEPGNQTGDFAVIGLPLLSDCGAASSFKLWGSWPLHRSLCLIITTIMSHKWQLKNLSNTNWVSKCLNSFFFFQNSGNIKWIYVHSHLPTCLQLSHAPPSSVLLPFSEVQLIRQLARPHIWARVEAKERLSSTWLSQTVLDCLCPQLIFGVFFWGWRSGSPVFTALFVSSGYAVFC